MATRFGRPHLMVTKTLLVTIYYGGPPSFFVIFLLFLSPTFFSFSSPPSSSCLFFPVFLLWFFFPPPHPKIYNTFLWEPREKKCPIITIGTKKKKLQKKFIIKQTCFELTLMVAISIKRVFLTYF